MNGQRTVRKYIIRLTDEDLYGLHEAAKKDESLEGMIVYYLTTIELERRKLKKK